MTEPLLNQVGVYSELDMRYLGTLGRGNVPYQTPTSILALSMGGLALVDQNKLYIYDKYCHLLQVREAVINQTRLNFGNHSNGGVLEFSQ